jgi:hypothetical protein
MRLRPSRIKITKKMRRSLYSRTLCKVNNKHPTQRISMHLLHLEMLVWYLVVQATYLEEKHQSLIIKLPLVDIITIRSS